MLPTRCPSLRQRGLHERWALPSLGSSDCPRVAIATVGCWHETGSLTGGQGPSRKVASKVASDPGDLENTATLPAPGSRPVWKKCLGHLGPGGG